VDKMPVKIEDLVKKKIIFITGKGGVGKSTVSAALSNYLAEKGERVMSIDADPAHSLPDVFGITKKAYGSRKGFISNGKIIKIYDDSNNDLLLLNPIASREKYTGSYRIMWLAELGKEMGFYSNLGRMSEFFTLADTLWKSFGRYDHFVIDNEPSAGTLDMIENIEGWINGLDNVKKYKLIFNMVLGAGIKDKQLVQEAKEIMFGQNGAYVEEYKQMLRSIKKLFTSKEYFEPILVASPEDAVIRETYRLKSELEEKLNIPNHYVIFNKVIVDNPEIRKYQQNRISEFEKGSGAKIMAIPYLRADSIRLSDERNARESLREISKLMSS
jgi:arsenite-transporting ATPase